MSKPPSDKTLLRSAIADARRYYDELLKIRGELAQFRARATKAEQECAEWKARFDKLLSREDAK